MKATKVLFLLVISTVLLTTSCNKRKMKTRGCTDAISSINTVSDGDTLICYVPSAFTPNGDGFNDVFEPIGVGYDSVSIIIWRNNKEIWSTEQTGETIWTGENRAGYYTYKIFLIRPNTPHIELEGNLVSFLNMEDPNSVDNCTSCIYSDMIHPTEGIINPQTFDPVSCSNQ